MLFVLLGFGRLSLAGTMAGAMLILALLHALPAHSAIDDILSNPAEFNDSGGGPEFEVFCKSAQIPCGFEAAETLDFGHREHLPGPNFGETGREYLNRLVTSSMKAYGWRSKNGLLEILPKSVLTGKKISPLDKLIPKIDIDNLYVSSAAATVCAIAGVARQANMWSVAPKGKVTLHLSNVSVRQALNEIVKQDGKAMWMVYPESGRLIILTESLRHGWMDLKELEGK